ncbi:hypothetical protein E2986_14109 [Frieseomelitta varia]|uniref:Uncharacterized protein n=1 Tax=Frieseomelitta varia TaxID=561572 RepID=A0A833RUB8_9HYME|nr:hypothetical protein E2986_14109 [Frieseomelitta varia]
MLILRLDSKLLEKHISNKSIFSSSSAALQKDTDEKRLFSDEANQTRQQRQVSGDNGEQAASDNGRMFRNSSEAEVVVRELRPIEAVISRFFASPVEKSQPKIDAVVSRHERLETPDHMLKTDREAGRIYLRKLSERTDNGGAIERSLEESKKRYVPKRPILGCNL